MREYVLFISHNIYLTKEQRYDLASGKSLKVIGSNVPVWFYKFNTSEPATEIFCQYTITNEPGPISVVSTLTGYTINIPQMPEDYEPPEHITNSKWREMSLAQQEQWYEDHPHPLTGKALLDVKDGGSAYMKFQYEIRRTWNKRLVQQSHQIEIKDIDYLMNSLVV